MNETPPRPESPPPLGPVLRHYGPWLGAIVGMVILSAGIVDLRGRVAALEERLTAHAVAPSDAPPPPITAPPPPASQVVSVSTGTSPPEWSCDGSLTEEQVRAAVGRQGSTAMQCIADRLASAPSLAGVVTVRLRVDGTGHTSDVYVSGIDDATLVGCLGNTALAWTFDAPTNGSCAIVEAPFVVSGTQEAP
jgi:hypothetical protein